MAWNHNGYNGAWQYDSKHSVQASVIVIQRCASICQGYSLLYMAQWAQLLSCWKLKCWYPTIHYLLKCKDFCLKFKNDVYLLVGTTLLYCFLCPRLTYFHLCSLSHFSMTLSNSSLPLIHRPAISEVPLILPLLFNSFSHFTTNNNSNLLRMSLSYYCQS